MNPNKKTNYLILIAVFGFIAALVTFAISFITTQKAAQPNNSQYKNLVIPAIALPSPKAIPPLRGKNNPEPVVTQTIELSSPEASSATNSR